MSGEAQATGDRAETLDRYGWMRVFPTRWHDNDVFGHVNNTIYYAAMDTTVTSWLLTEARLNMADSGDMAVVVASSCRYFASGAFPDTLLVGLRADKIGRTSVSWGLGIFRESDGELLATGAFVHVFVDRDERRPIPVPSAIADRIRHELTIEPNTTEPSAPEQHHPPRKARTP